MAKSKNTSKGASSSAKKQVRRSKASSSASASAKKKNAEGLQPRTKQEIKAIIFVFLCFMLAMSYYTPFFGIVGSFIKNLGMFFFGLTAYIIPVFAVIAGVHMLIKGTIKPHVHRYVAAILACVCVSGLLAVHAYRMNPTLFGSGYTAEALEAAQARNPDLQIYKYSGFIDLLEGIVSSAKNGSGGGIAGYLASILFIRIISPIGTTVLLWALLLVFAALATGKAPFLRMVDLIRAGIERVQERDEGEDAVLPPFGELEEVNYGVQKKPAEPERKTEKKKEPVKKKGVSAISAALKEKLSRKDEAEAKKPTAKSGAKSKKTASGKSKGGASAKSKKDSEKQGSARKLEPEIVVPQENSDENQVKIKMFDGNASAGADIPDDIKELAMAESGAVQENNEDTSPIPVTDDEIETDYIPYRFPPLNLLGREKLVKEAVTTHDDIRRMGQKLVETLESFGVKVKINEIVKGPAITRFEISPAPGVKVNKIVNLANDIALNLAAVSVRVIAPIPGKAAVGIEIPNDKIATVRLRDVIDTDAFKNFKSKTAFALGKDVNGRVIIADISKMPHLLIAGATGSGKSVCINSLITSIMYKADPNEVKMIMIDPKVVELGVYNGIPHLLIPVVTDPRRAAGALNWAVQEMVKRYRLFAENNVRNLSGYNELAEVNGDRKLEQIIIIVDELADLMMVSAKEVEDSICRLAQMARAAGMYLVIATQRPSVDVITGLIKANIPSRIAFSVSNQIDSRTILDMGGAEKLLGRGDMLYLPMGANTPTRIQGAFVSDAETEAIVEYVKQDFDAKYDEDIIEHIERGAESDRDREENAGDADEMLPAAMQAVVEAGQASASLLQRRLKVGYARAGRLIDQLEERGIIGPHEGSKPRAVLISRSQLMELEASGKEL